MESEALRLTQVEKAFRSRSSCLLVLHDLSFSVQAETWVTLLGPSGCGKTTLLRILAGLVAPDTGQVVLRTTPSQDKMTAYLPQHNTLLPWRTVLGNAVLSSEVDRRPMVQARQEARQLLERFGLSGFEQRYPSQLSGGMRQRLALIRTFLSHRSILLLDEPLGALDPLTRAKMQDWLLSVWSEFKKTVLLVTHDPEEALLLSDRVLVLSQRPACVLRDEAIDLPRPRDRGSMDMVRRRFALLDLLLDDRRVS